MPIQFNDTIDVEEFTRASDSELQNLFWEEDEIAEFRHRAFLIEVGVETETLGDESLEGSLDGSLQDLLANGNDADGNTLKLEATLQQMHSSLPVVEVDFSQLETKRKHKEQQQKIQRAQDRREAPGRQKDMQQRNIVIIPDEILLTTDIRPLMKFQTTQESKHEEEKVDTTSSRLSVPPPPPLDVADLHKEKHHRSTGEKVLAKFAASQQTDGLMLSPTTVTRKKKLSARRAIARPSNSPVSRKRRSLVSDMVEKWSHKDEMDSEKASPPKASSPKPSSTKKKTTATKKTKKREEKRSKSLNDVDVEATVTKPSSMSDISSVPVLSQKPKEPKTTSDSSDNSATSSPKRRSKKGTHANPVIVRRKTTRTKKTKKKCKSLPILSPMESGNSWDTQVFATRSRQPRPKLKSLESVTSTSTATTVSTDIDEELSQKTPPQRTTSRKKRPKKSSSSLTEREMAAVARLRQRFERSLSLQMSS